MPSTTLAALSVALCLPAADASPPATEVVQGAVGQRLDRYLTWAEQFGFSGVVLVALDGRLVLHKPYGLANRATGAANQLDSVFSFGSITKQFTAAAVMKLAQQGKLRTNDTIVKYFENVPPDKQAITIHQLLTHTAGLIDYHGISDFQKMDRDTAVRAILKAPLESPPGTDFYYSNSGYTLAAAIVELVSGRDYQEFMQEEIFRPAGMTETGFMGNDLWGPTRPAHIYRGTHDKGSPADKPGPYWVLLGNGGVVSTVGQMYLWDRALRGETILNDATKRKLFTPVLNDYAYGWDVLQTDRGTTQHRHDGGSILGLSAQFERYVEEDGAFILASNATIGDSLAIELVAAPVSRLIFAPGPALGDVPPLQDRSDQLDRYAGRYELAGGGEFLVYADGGQPFFAAEGQPALDLVDPRAASLGDQVAQLNTTARHVIEAVFADDLDPLQSALSPSDEPADKRAQRWARLIRSQGREFQKVDILGTTNLGTEAEPEPVTWLRLHFKDGSRVGRFHWHDGKLRGLGGDAWPHPFDGPLRFTPAGEGRVFQFSTGRTLAVRFEPADGKPAALAVGGARGVRTASR